MRKVFNFSCKQCGCSFSLSSRNAFRHGSDGQQFCSKSCAMKYLHAQRGQGEIKRVCEHCGEVFTKEGWVVRKGKGKFCSKECYTAHLQITLVCVVCHKEFTIPRWLGRNNRKCCSGKCAAKYRGIHYRGAQHINWKGGASPYPLEWTKELRAAIRKRDGGACAICGKQQRGLCVHHIDWDKNNCSPENLISLCTHHHLKTHGPKRAETWKVLLSVAAKMRVVGWVEGAGN